jgi:type IV fimbrial biogenesis protein FimT
MMRRYRGFTLVELLVALAIVGIILTVAAPSFRSMIEMKRLRGIHAQVITDMNYARSEAVTRNMYLRVVVGSSPAMTCYSLYTSPNNGDRCDCSLATPALRCPAPLVEVRSVQVPTSLGVTVSTPVGMRSGFAYDHVTGGLVTIPRDLASEPLPLFVIRTFLDTEREVQTQLNQAGRVTICSPAGSTTGEAACP